MRCRRSSGPATQTGGLEWVNDRWTELTGLSREESLEEKGALRAVHPDDREHVQRSFARALTDAAPCEMEYRVLTREGCIASTSRGSRRFAGETARSSAG